MHGCAYIGCAGWVLQCMHGYCSGWLGTLICGRWFRSCVLRRMVQGFMYLCMFTCLVGVFSRRFFFFFLINMVSSGVRGARGICTTTIEMRSKFFGSLKVSVGVAR